MSILKLENEILNLVKEYYLLKNSNDKIEPGKDIIPVSGKSYNENEVVNLTQSALDFWLTAGRFNKEFEKKLSNFLGIKYVLTTNSGSSANLLAVSALTSEKLGNKRLLPGDEIITVAAGFPTTINPIIQNNLKPVFVDVDIGTYNINTEALKNAISKKTKAIVLAHTLGNPYDLDEISEICKRNDLYLIEDCADALGARFNDKIVGSFGNIATISFYPAHHITTGEGGAVYTKNSLFKVILESFRDWGRDCYCEPGEENTCKKRYDWLLGDLPHGYDHKYIYAHAGYNLKLTDMQAAVGSAQIDKIDIFINKRKKNFKKMYELFKNLEDYIYLPECHKLAEPSWFGFPITLKSNDTNFRTKLLKYYEEKKIGNRLLFGGNIIKQPYMKNREYKIIGDLKNTNKIMNSTFWLGVHPRINDEHISYMFECTKKFFKK